MSTRWSFHDNFHRKQNDNILTSIFRKSLKLEETFDLYPDTLLNTFLF